MRDPRMGSHHEAEGKREAFRKGSARAPACSEARPRGSAALCTEHSHEIPSPKVIPARFRRGRRKQHAMARALPATLSRRPIHFHMESATLTRKTIPTD
jgi:hypothetical protein